MVRETIAIKPLGLINMCLLGRRKQFCRPPDIEIYPGVLRSGIRSSDHPLFLFVPFFWLPFSCAEDDLAFFYTRKELGFRVRS